ncbi:MAG: AraC family ligand binding domain-containing protein [Clostridia bacterium]|nr:AraC family ligand binding domain-containing protein [Clostridia bacterium]
MNAYTIDNYSSYNFTVGDADFVFFTIPPALSDKQTVGTTMHSHKFYEMFYVLKGNIIISTEIGEVNLTEKDVAIVSPGTTHTTAITPGSLRICLTFSITKNKSVTNSSYFEAFQHILNHQVLRIDSFAGAHAFKRFARYFQSNSPEKK